MAKVLEWTDPRCVVCFDNADLTVEHVIPESLGGILSCRFLCKDCNSRFGSGFEANARLAPELRQAASSLIECYDLADRLEIRAQYQSSFGEVVGEARLSNEGAIGTMKLNDGSVIVPEHSAEKKLREMLRKNGASDAESEVAIEAWQAAPHGEAVPLGSGIVVRKWLNHPARPTYSEAALSPLVPLKIAFEFLALIVGSALYHENSGLDTVRQALFQQDEDFAKQVVDARLAEKPAPFHGIAFQGNVPDAQFQVRLFGYLAYLVRFPKVRINQERLSYTHKLDTREDWVTSQRCRD